jgi:hypothetical protein
MAFEYKKIDNEYLENKSRRDFGLTSWAHTRVVIPGVRRPFGGCTGRAALSITPYMNRAPTIDREITVPNLLYCSNFSYYFLPTWSRGGWQSRWLPTEVRQRPFDPSNLPWAVSQCPFDPYQAGAKVYRAYRAGGRPAQ